jgi:replicative DNA helicase
VEGEIDALSLIEVGAEAVGLGMARNHHKLLELLEKKPTKATLILCLDDDKGKEHNTGAEAQEELREGLEKLNISYITGTTILLGCNDPNEALVKDRAGFSAAVAEAEHRTAARPDNVKDYLTRLMAGEIDRFKQGATRRTGYPNLDEKAGGVYPGLYVLGAISSLGKTTFIHQMADQMAAMGEDVLYFSLEQSRLEMVSKSLSRLTAQKDVSKAVTSLAIRGGNLTPAVLDAADHYAAMVEERMSVVEGNFLCTVEYISDYVTRYMATTGTKPILIIDYLQIIQGDPRQSTREAVEANVTELKRISRSKDIPVFIISSLNRSNYMTPVDYESFKETGGIEYTADVLWGLQLDVLNDPLFDKEGKVKEKRDKIRKAKAETPRKVELLCLKNRYGIATYKVGFTYYPQFDLFVPREVEE